jgi:hypothetical protein
MKHTIALSDPAGRGRMRRGAQYIKLRLAPPLPACERAPAADVGGSEGTYRRRSRARFPAPGV